MISKKTFCKIIRSIKEQDEIDEKFGKALETVCDSWCMYGTKNKKYDALWILLKEIFKDESDWISWWMYEAVEKKIYDKSGKKVIANLKTSEDLYDYLTKSL